MKHSAGIPFENPIGILIAKWTIFSIRFEILHWTFIRWQYNARFNYFSGFELQLYLIKSVFRIIITTSYKNYSFSEHYISSTIYHKLKVVAFVIEFFVKEKDIYYKTVGWHLKLKVWVAYFKLNTDSIVWHCIRSFYAEVHIV